MNRKERRTQGKAMSPRHGARQEVRETFETALRHHRAGQLNEAEDLYRQVLAVDSRNADALNMLGVIARQVGRSDVAVELVGKAIGINGKIAFYHSNLGNALKDLGRLEDAVAAFNSAIGFAPDLADTHNILGNTLKDMGRLEGAVAAYDSAIRLKPDYAEAHNNLANTLKDMGRFEDAIAAYNTAIRLRPDMAGIHYNLGVAFKDMGQLEEAVVAYNTAIAVKPDYAEAHNNLGNALKDMGRLEDAVAAYNAAIAFKPDLAEPHNNLGGTLKDLGRLEEAVVAYDAAIRLKPDYAEAYCNMGVVLCELGNPQDGLSCCVQSLKLKETTQGKLSFVECLIRLQPLNIPDQHIETALRALCENWSKPTKLAPIVIATIKSNLASSGIHDAAAFPGNRSKEQSDWAVGRLANETLLLRLMKQIPIHDASLEKILTTCRTVLLGDVTSGLPVTEFPAPVLAFFGALANQCFINEFVFDCTEDEFLEIRQLENEILSSLAEGRTVNALKLIALGCYVPLHSLPDSENLLQLQWHESVNEMLVLQIAEPLQERKIRADIPSLTSIDTGVSSLVRQQYEENPYPRWLRTEPLVPCASIEFHIRNQIPRVLLAPLKGPTTDILIAGCGTGLHPIETALIFPAAKVLAIDLSRSSLGYAMRKANELGLHNLQFAQADILKLGEIGRQFEVIESVGVLHHLGDPEAGLKVLVSLLKPNGFLRLGLYSARARRNVVAVRDFIAEKAFGSSTEDIRLCRRELLALEETDIRRTVVKWDDFASVSGCRDLLFHVQEHRLTLPEIGRWLEQFNLTFLGFDISPETSRAFQSSFPNPGSETDLGLWDIYENRNPEIFNGMYQFWVQKAA